MTTFWRVLGLSAFLLPPSSFGCARPPRPGHSDVPAGVRNVPGVYVDVNPRWSHDGKRIAFLRATPDRRMQLHVADEDLERAHALFTPELLCPDRPYSPELQRYSSPDTLAWSPEDRLIAFERIEWFTFEDGERLPGTALWSFDTHTRAVQPLALHTAKYKSLFYYYHAPQWSPDSRYLAFVGEGINGQRTVFVRPLHAQNAKEVTPRFDHFEDSDWPVWRREEKEIGTGNREQGTGNRNTIHNPQSSTANPEHLNTRTPEHLIPNTKHQTPNTLFFRQGLVHALEAPPTETLRRLSPGNPKRESGSEVWRMRARALEKSLAGEQGERARTVAIAPRAGHLAWSPDGKRLAFTLTPDANDYNQYALWVIQADGTGARQVSPQDGRGYLAPVWIGNERLGAISPHTGRFDVVTIHLGSHHKRLLGAVATSDCDWSPDRRKIVYAMPPDAQGRSPESTTLRLLETDLKIAANERK